MPEYRKNSLERVRTALTIKQHGESDKSVLELIRELRRDE